MNAVTKNTGMVVLLDLVLLPCLADAAERPASRRPNFVLMYADDQRYDAMSVVQQEQGEQGRFPWFKTPHMDRIAREGFRFRNAFVVNSLCAPSRACFLTGRYSHLNGVANNHTPFPVDNATHASLLRKAGYVTAYVGKWHMSNQSGQRPGFDYSASFVGQGRYFDCPVEINGTSTPTTGWVDDVSTDFAIEFIRKHRERPFFLVLGFKAPHGPWTQLPERAQQRFADAQARPAPNAAAVPPYMPLMRKKPIPATTAADQPRTNLGYFRCISAVDDNVGRVLAALDELKLADDTMVIYTSDNGYYLGEHGLGDKRSAYDTSLRIPFLMRYPRLGRGKLIDQMVLNIDLAPTLLDLADVAIPPQMQGRSWRGLVEGRPVEWRKAFFYDYFFERGFNTPTVLAVRTETAKLIKYPGHDGWTELFDLRADPHEMKNLAGDPAHKDLLAAMQAEFDHQARAIDFKIPAFADNPDDPAPERPAKPRAKVRRKS